jgi:hypothetical protein
MLSTKRDVYFRGRLWAVGLGAMYKREYLGKLRRPAEGSNRRLKYGT